VANTRTAIEIAIVDGATRVLNEIRNGTRAVQSSFTELNSALELVGKGFAALGQAAGFAKDLLQPARDAETAMQRVAVATNATEAELIKLRETSNAVAFDLRVPFDQVAAGAEQLARDGASAAEVIANIAPVSAFAKSALIKTAEAAGQLSDVLDGYGEDIGNIGAIGDAIVATAGAAGASAADLLEGVKKLGPVASDAGVGINSVVGLLGALAEKGIGGAKAVKALETIFLEFKDPAKGAGEAIRSLGLDAANLPAILQRLSTDSAAAALVLAEFDGKPKIALQKLLEDGGGALTKLTEVINNSGGASKKAADDLAATFDGAVARIGIALTELQASFFDPVLAPLAAEIDVVSAKIKAFAGTQDFANLQAVVLDFVKQTVEQLKVFSDSFDFSAAVESTRRFIAATTVAFAVLGETFGNARKYFNAFLVVVNGLELGLAKLVQYTAELSLLQIRAAEAIGITSDAQTEYKLILEDVIRSAEREAEVNKKDLVDSLNLATGATQEAAAAAVKLAAEQTAAAAATKSHAEAQKELQGVLPAVVDALKAGFDGVAVTLAKTKDSAKEAGKEIKRAAEVPSGSIDELRQRLIILNAALVKAFKEGGNTAILRAEIKATEAQVTALEVAANKAAQGTKNLGDSAEETAPKIREVAEAASEGAAEVEKLDAAAASAGDGLKSTGATAIAAGQDLGTVSDEFARLISGYALYDTERSERLGKALAEERDAIERRIRDTTAQIAALDPLEQAIKRIRQQYKFVGEEVRVLAQQELQLTRQREGAGQPGAPAAGGQSSGGRSEPVFNFSFPSLNPGDLSDATIKDLARRVAAPLRAYYAGSI
jgi:TP901 family phage tail tape measure protein